MQGETCFYHQDQFNSASYKPWLVDGAVVRENNYCGVVLLLLLLLFQAGSVKGYDLLTLLEIDNAGHQVPMFVPKQVSTSSSLSTLSLSLSVSHYLYFFQALSMLDSFITDKPFA